MCHEDGIADGSCIVWEDVDGSGDVFGEEEVKFGVIVLVVFIVLE